MLDLISWTFWFAQRRRSRADCLRCHRRRIRRSEFASRRHVVRINLSVQVRIGRVMLVVALLVSKRRSRCRGRGRLAVLEGERGRDDKWGRAMVVGCRLAGVGGRVNGLASSLGVRCVNVVVVFDRRARCVSSCARCGGAFRQWRRVVWSRARAAEAGRSGAH